MKPHLPLLLSLTLATPLLAQDSKPAQPAETKAAKIQPAETSTATETIAEINQKFSNLPKKTREEFAKKLIRTQNLFNQKRIFDALENIYELDKIFPNHPAVLNIKGACYVEIRAFKKANAVFTKILRMSPNNTNVLFNLAEVDFVTKNWPSAEERFTKLIPLLPKNNKPMIRLCEFKLLLSKLKLNKKDEAKALMEKYGEWDDSPFYYYSRAALAFDEGDKTAAEKFLRNARYVWNNNAALSAWQDTLIEFGDIQSFYGGNSQEEK